MWVVCSVSIIYPALDMLHHVAMLCSDAARAVCRNTYAVAAGDCNNIIAANLMDVVAMDLATLWLIIVMQQFQLTLWNWTWPLCYTNGIELCRTAIAMDFDLAEMLIDALGTIFDAYWWCCHWRLLLVATTVA
jgi:hypothetical protein